MSRSLALSAVVLAFASLVMLAAAGAVRADDGQALYSDQCAKCHGAQGQSDTPVGKAMKVPKLAGKSWTEAELVSAVRENKKHASVSKKVSDADLTAIAAFMAGFGD